MKCNKSELLLRIPNKTQWPGMLTHYTEIDFLGNIRLLDTFMGQESLFSKSLFVTVQSTLLCLV